MSSNESGGADKMDMDPNNATEQTATAAADKVIQTVESEARSLKRDIDGEVQAVIKKETDQKGGGDGGPIVKKARIEDGARNGGRDARDSGDGRRKGVAPVKKEFLIDRSTAARNVPVIDDDAAESGTHPHTSNSVTGAEGSNNSNNRRDDRGPGGGGKKNKKKRERGQNKNRKFQFQHDAIQLCPHLINSPSTTSPLPCGRINFGNEGDREGRTVGYVNPECKYEHDIKKYLETGKKDDLEGICLVWDARGECLTSGWRCRWLKSHMRELENGEKELIVDEERKEKYLESVMAKNSGDEVKVVAEGGTEVLNEVDMSFKVLLRKNKYVFKKSQAFLDEEDAKDKDNNLQDKKNENQANYTEARIPNWEKRPLDISPDRPILAPLTTVGNLPFRRLCTSLGAAMTYSEMAMSLPLLQGQKSEWALLRSHASEVPNFGAQICAMKPWQAVKAVEVITDLIPARGMSLIDLNCGCPIDMVYQSGGGSALLDQNGKLLKMLRGMSRVSGETPITCKIRMGTKDSNPTAKKLLRKLWDSGDVAAVTLHGRSRQQRYTREADWSYISECASLIEFLKGDSASTTDPTTSSSISTADYIDTSAYKDSHDLPQPTSSSTHGAGLGGRTGHGLYFIGNGDIYSHYDYTTHLTTSPNSLDSIMIARGALIKPWLFEEIATSQYLDKSATERLSYISQFARYGLETWGSDEFGVGTTRRFLCEWLSFACRYVPLGILEYLPPKIQDRPPAWKGRNELESLLGSHDYRDWIRISEMFLGKTPEGWEFKPKHKSNSYEEVEAEG